MSSDGRTALFIRRPDGWSGPCQLEVWDLDAGKRSIVIRQRDGISALFSLSGDGRYVAVADDIYGPGNSKAVRLIVWDARTGAEIGQATLDSVPAGGGWAGPPVFSPDGRYLLYACGSQNTGFYHCLDRATVKVRWQKTLAGAGFPTQMPDGRILLLLPGSAQAVSWADGKEDLVRLPPDFKPHTEVGFTATGAAFLYIVGEGERREVRVWDWKNGRPAPGFRAVALGANAWATTSSTRGRADVFLIDGGWRLCDLQTGRPVWAEAGVGHTEAVTALVFSADGRTLASASEDMTIRLWDVPSGRPLGRWPAAPSGGYWEWQAGGGQCEFANGPPGVDLSPDARRLVFVAPGKDRQLPRLRVIDTRTGQTVATRPLPAAKGAGNAGFGRARFGPDGTAVWTSYGEWDANRWAEPIHTLARWDFDTHRWRELGKVRPSPPTRGAAAGNRWLAAGEVYDAASGRRAFELIGYAYGPLVTSPEGRLVAGLGRSAEGPELRYTLEADRDVRVWDSRTGSPIALLPWHPPARPVPLGPGPAGLGNFSGAAAVAWPRQFAFHPSGRWLATNDPAGVRLWDLVSCRVVHTIPVPNRPPMERHNGSPATALAFTPDGSQLATGLPDGTILLWPVPIPTPNPPRADELAGLWADLMGSDSAKGWRAAWRLMDDPAAAVKLVRAHLKPAERVPAAEVAKLLADVDAPEFRRREAATRRLEAIIDQALPAVAEAEKAAGASAELRERLQKVLATAPGDDKALPAGAAAQGRAVAVLEHVRTPEATAVLRDLAGGAPGAWLTREAEAALARLKHLK